MSRGTGSDQASALAMFTKVHGKLVHKRRVKVLAEQIGQMLPADCQTVLDVGCGDGTLDWVVMQDRPGLNIRGIDVLARPASRIHVDIFDGSHIPMADQSCDVLMMIDVLHHTDDPNILLAESRRVARLGVLIKDHTRENWLGGATLQFMDWVGNRGHGVRLPYNYWPMSRWEEAWSGLGLRVAAMRRRLGIYPAWARPIFETNLHFMAYLTPG